MARTNRRKPYYTLRELLARWAMDGDDISAYVLEGELCLSLPVAALLVGVRDAAPSASVTDAAADAPPVTRRHQVGPIDLSRIDAYAVLQNGAAQVTRFDSVAGEILEPLAEDGSRRPLVVKRGQLVVRHDELERFEMEHDLGQEADTAPSPIQHRGRWQAPMMRGAPARHDWEECLCELGAIAHDEGLPETQALLVRRMLDWFSVTYGPENVPSESAVKQRVSRFWHRLRGDGGRGVAPAPLPRRGVALPGGGKVGRVNS